MPLTALWGKLTGGIIGAGIGIAAADAVAPVLELAKQDAWYENPHKPLEVDQIAQLVAAGMIAPGDAETEAKRTGYDANKVFALTQLAMSAPSPERALELLRRRHIDRDALKHAFRKAGLEPEWDEALIATLFAPLEPADLANAVQQGFVPNAGLLPDDPGGAPPFTPPTDEVPLNTLEEFAAGGMNEPHAKVLSQLVGLPPGVEELLTMWNRGIITETAVDHGIREGHTKTKWTSALKELRRFVLSPYDYAGLRLRGWLNEDQAAEGGALSGASREAMELLFLNRGRPAAPGQMYTAAVRGVDGPDGRPMDEAQFLKGIKESDIRPEWGPMLWAVRYLYPTLFQLNKLVESGTITADEAAAWATKDRYAPEVVTALHKSWSGGSPTTSARWAGRARSRLFTVAHNEYLAGSIDEATARTTMTTIGVAAGEQVQVLIMWNTEKAISRLELTPAEIRRQYRKSIITETDALTELEAKGMTAADATKYLQN